MVRKLIIPALGAMALVMGAAGGDEIGLDTATDTAPTARKSSNCHPSYKPCIPDGPDLNCDDIPFRVKVVGPDEYHLNADPDKDDTGCDNNPPA